MRTAKKTSKRKNSRSKTTNQRKLGRDAEHRANNADKVNVFLSYASDDYPIAVTLSKELVDINRGRITVFLDMQSIEPGKDWREAIDQALDNADWLVCIYTGQQSEFCGYEIGVFTKGRHLSKEPSDSRFVCLHDRPDIPAVFGTKQNKLVIFPSDRALAADPIDEVAFYKQSPLFTFFAALCAYKNLYLPDAQGEQTETLVRKTKVLTEAFKAARGFAVRVDTPTQLGIEVMVSSSKDAAALDRIPNESIITGTFGSFRLFGLMPHMENRQLPATTWARLRAACESPLRMSVMWMERLEKDMISAANGIALGASDASFAGEDDKIYRAVLVRHLVHWNGSQTFGIVFVETLPRQFIGKRKTSLVLAALVLSSRFRFSYLEEPETITGRFGELVPLREFETNCQQLRYDIERMEQEAVEFSILDSREYSAAFGEERRAEIETILTHWNAESQKLMRTLPTYGKGLTEQDRPAVQKAIFEFFNYVEPENTRFITMAAQVYLDEVKRQTRKAT
jgi:TIR domain-containing protein